MIRDATMEEVVLMSDESFKKDEKWLEHISQNSRVSKTSSFDPREVSCSELQGEAEKKSNSDD